MRKSTARAHGSPTPDPDEIRARLTEEANEVSYLIGVPSRDRPRIVTATVRLAFPEARRDHRFLSDPNWRRERLMELMGCVLSREYLRLEITHLDHAHLAELRVQREADEVNERLLLSLLRWYLIDEEHLSEGVVHELFGVGIHAAARRMSDEHTAAGRHLSFSAAKKRLQRALTRAQRYFGQCGG